MDRPLQRGEYVTLRITEGPVPVELVAFVGLASDNGESLIVFADGMIAGFVGAAPLLWRDGGWWTLNGVPVTLERRT